ncbi:MAG TPA: YiiX/YebB-like N1pC/P60 family cysteine hydrolase [Gemmatimonadales bacterium]|nr:YiiX/YebB-like N1pC/P60 family cysteine hydrolase [Gemmatimonadales bacterium]
MTESSARPAPRRAAGALLGVVLLGALLAVPSGAPSGDVTPSSGRPFVWDRDTTYEALQYRFEAARTAGCSGVAATDSAFVGLTSAVDAVSSAAALSVGAPSLDSLEHRLFTVGAIVAACPARQAEYLALAAQAREAVKRHSRAWDMTRTETRDRLYRALYGTRAAIEEVLLQQPAASFALSEEPTAPSAAPSAVVHGVTLHSGDLLVSRGGYPTSALIARGSDYPGNFSHVALVHVDQDSHEVLVIEAHIERGVAVATAEVYLADKKLRVLVLRPRADLPALRRDPLLPHRAASAMLDRGRAEHIPYDFAMDYSDPSRLFCSEVASATYATQGVTLWTGISTITAPGLRRWLGGFGVTHFETQEPSDLEYDPQLVTVAEWRDPAALRGDHIDNAVTDAMLEGAERGDVISFQWWQLPAARLLKGYSVVREALGGVGPIPEGMSAAAALRNKAYTTRHRELAVAVDAAATAWEAERGYPPPYWVLVQLARDAVAGEGR